MSDAGRQIGEHSGSHAGQSAGGLGYRRGRIVRIRRTARCSSQCAAIDGADARKFDCEGLATACRRSCVP